MISFCRGDQVGVGGGWGGGGGTEKTAPMLI